MTIETEDVVAQLRTRIEEHRAHLAQMEAKYGGPLVHHESGVGIVVNFGDLIELVARDQSLSERIAVLEMSLARCQECNRRHMRAKYRSPKAGCRYRKEANMTNNRFAAIDFAEHKTAFRKRVKKALALSPSELLAHCHFDVGEPAQFKVVDAEGEHDPCYLVIPGGSMLPLNHFADELTDVCRALFIAEACNVAYALRGLLTSGTASLTSFDGHCVRIDFETREEAEALFDALASAGEAGDAQDGDSQ